MGQRAYVAVVLEDNSAVYLFTHWSGELLPRWVQTALKTEGLDRGNHLAAAIARQMDLSRIDTKMIFGIPDSGTIVVNCKTQRVGFAQEKGVAFFKEELDQYLALAEPGIPKPVRERFVVAADMPIYKDWSFEEYRQLDWSTIDAQYERAVNLTEAIGEALIEKNLAARK
ncbi:MAG: hypothetical protein WBC04_03270 [Candidatus Acidiferrales bacterium]